LTSDHKTKILLALIGLLGTVTVAAFGNWDKIFPPERLQGPKLLITPDEGVSKTPDPKLVDISDKRSLKAPDIKLCQKLQSEVCGVDAHIKKQSASCGFNINSGTGAVCGVDKYQSKKDKLCGTNIDEEIYLWPNRVATGASVINGNGRGHSCKALSLNDATNKCLEKGYDFATGRYGEPSIGKPCNDEFVSCGVYNTCEHKSFKVLSYKKCEHGSFGKTAKSCAHPDHGVLRFKICEVNFQTGEKCTI